MTKLDLFTVKTFLYENACLQWVWSIFVYSIKLQTYISSLFWPIKILTILYSHEKNVVRMKVIIFLVINKKHNNLQSLSKDPEADPLTTNKCCCIIKICFCHWYKTKSFQIISLLFVLQFTSKYNL